MNNEISGVRKDEGIRRFAALVEASFNAGVLKKCVMSVPANGAIVKRTLEPMRLGGETAVRVVTRMRDGKEIQKNRSDIVGAAEELFGTFSRGNLITTVGEAEYRRSKSGNFAIIGEEKLASRLSRGVSESDKVSVSGNDRAKKRILTGREPFLIELGVSADDGRIYDKKQAKFRQICRFLEYVRDAETHLPHDEIFICDLCCGKSYLSFAVYHYFAIVKGMRVKMTCVDLKPDVVAFCSAAAKRLGFDGLEFICGDVLAYVPERTPDIVVSLHACDTATDIVIGRAAEWRVPVLLSTPCCQHELAGKIDCPALEFATRDPLMRRKLCDALTDSLRIAYLRSRGYAVDASELVDPDDTPKNVLLRAVIRKGFDPRSREAIEARKKYDESVAFLLNGGQLFIGSI